MTRDCVGFVESVPENIMAEREKRERRSPSHSFTLLAIFDRSTFHPVVEMLKRKKKTNLNGKYANGKLRLEYGGKCNWLRKMFRTIKSYLKTMKKNKR